MIGNANAMNKRILLKVLEVTNVYAIMKVALLAMVMVGVYNVKTTLIKYHL